MSRSVERSRPSSPAIASENYTSPAVVAGHTNPK
jgi:hypothetical protein